MIRPRTERLARNLRREGIPVAVAIRTRSADPDLIVINPQLAIEVFGDLQSVSLIHESRTGFRARLVDPDAVLTLVLDALAENLADVAEAI